MVDQFCSIPLNVPSINFNCNAIDHTEHELTHYASQSSRITVNPWPRLSGAKVVEVWPAHWILLGISLVACVSSD